MGTAPDILKPHTRDLGGFTVERILPGWPHKTVGPFIFFDHFGPVDFAPGRNADVRPHPHIGLSTVTYLFEGEIVHRDSLGSMRRIAPGDVNWMTAGAGIVHSERTPPEANATGFRMHGIQTWLALPLAHEQDEPAFSHHPAATLPVIDAGGAHMRLVAGTFCGEHSPVPVRSPTFYVAAEMKPGAVFDLHSEHQERAVYLIEGEASVAGSTLMPHHMAVLAPGETVEIASGAGARLMLLGGEKMDGERFIWWNFVASSKEKIEAAKARWREQRFPPIPGETEFIPLPD